MPKPPDPGPSVPIESGAISPSGLISMSPLRRAVVFVVEPMPVSMTLYPGTGTPAGAGVAGGTSRSGCSCVL